MSLRFSGSDCGFVSPVALPAPTEPPAGVPLIPNWSASLTLDACTGVDVVLDMLLATPLVVAPLDIILVLLVVMDKELLEGNDEPTDMLAAVEEEDWKLSNISGFGFDMGALVDIPSLLTAYNDIVTIHNTNAVRFLLY